MPKKTAKKLKLNKKQILLAQRYEKAWHKLYYELPRWKQQAVVDDPDGRIANELAHESAILAESNSNID